MGEWHVTYRSHDDSNAPFYSSGVYSFDVDQFRYIGWPVGQPPASPLRRVAAPDWAVATLFLLLPVRWLMLVRKERRRSRVGFCPACGYDLRASPGRCPECGTEAPTGAVG